MGLKSERGQATVEFALLLPFLLLILFAILDFAWIFGFQLLETNACREAARACTVESGQTEAYYEQKAFTVFRDRAETLCNVCGVPETYADNNPITATLTPYGESADIKLAVSCDLPVLTPLASTVLQAYDGFDPETQTLKINAQIIMRIE
jgi:Flp pilus assembly protein TadG